MSIFSEQSYSNFYQQLFEEMNLSIISENDDYIISQPTEDLVKFYLSDSFNIIEFDLNREDTIRHDKYIKTIPAHERDWRYQQQGDLKMECERIVVTMPLLPNSKIGQIFKLRTSSISISGGPSFSIIKGDIIFDLEIKGYQRELDNNQIAARIVATKSEIQKIILAKNNEINSENRKLKSSLTELVEVRKQKLDGDKKRINDLVNLVKIPLERIGGDVVKKIYVEQKPYITKIKPRGAKEEYQLDRDKVVDIIKLIANQCLQFEKTPSTYNKFDEPNLRDLLLSNLNSVFEGKATGETFNNKGKTDIYLNIDKGNILVAECKFYGGKKLYHETIDQLLGYLTWRQNYGIMINFCRGKNFSKILEEAGEIIETHASFESDFMIYDKSHFISRHTLPQDDYKYVEIHHLYYNLYVANP